MSELHKVTRFINVEKNDNEAIYVTFESGDGIYLLTLRKGDVLEGELKITRFINVEKNGNDTVSIYFESGDGAYLVTLRKGDSLEGELILDLVDPVDKFVSFCFEFYGPDGARPIEGCTKETIEKATREMKRYEELLGDAYDRERVLEFIHEQLK